MKPCCWALVDVGDVRISSPDQIWNGDGFVEFRERMLRDELRGMCPSYCPVLTASGQETRSYFLSLMRRPGLAGAGAMADMLRGRTSVSRRPDDVKISPTTECNLRCGMCYQRHGRASESLPDDVVDSVLSLARDARLVRIQGGEVFFSSPGMRLVGRLVDGPPRRRIGVITNGTFPDSRAWALLANMALAWVMVSIDAADPSLYEELRPGADWSSTRANLMRLAALRATARRPFTLAITFTLLAANAAEIPGILRLAHELGIDVRFNEYWAIGETYALDVRSDPEALAAACLNLDLAEAYARLHRMPLAAASARSLRNGLRPPVRSGREVA